MFIQFDQPVNTSLFSPISIDTVECRTPVSSSCGACAGVMDYYVTEYPRRIDKDGPAESGFVYTLFESRLPAFAPNQSAVVEVSSALFAEAIPLTHFEEEILAKTLVRTAKKQATRPNRK